MELLFVGLVVRSSLGFIDKVEEELYYLSRSVVEYEEKEICWRLLRTEGGGGVLEFYVGGNEGGFGNAVVKNLVSAEVHVPYGFWSLSASSSAIYGRDSSFLMSDWEIQDGGFLCFKQ